MRAICFTVVALLLATSSAYAQAYANIRFGSSTAEAAQKLQSDEYNFKRTDMGVSRDNINITVFSGNLINETAHVFVVEHKEFGIQKVTVSFTDLSSNSAYPHFAKMNRLLKEKYGRPIHEVEQYSWPFNENENTNHEKALAVESDRAVIASVWDHNKTSILLQLSKDANVDVHYESELWSKLVEEKENKDKQGF